MKGEDVRPEQMKAKIKESLRLLNEVNNELDKLTTEADGYDSDAACEAREKLYKAIPLMMKAAATKSPSVRFEKSRSMKRGYLSPGDMVPRLISWGPTTLTLTVVYDHRELEDDGSYPCQIPCKEDSYMDEEASWAKRVSEETKAQSESQNTLMSFADARRLMAKRLRDDEGLYIGYQANVAMLLNDRYDITDHETRNQAAKDILWLIFNS